MGISVILEKSTDKGKEGGNEIFKILNKNKNKLINNNHVRFSNKKKKIRILITNGIYGAFFLKREYTNIIYYLSHPPKFSTLGREMILYFLYNKIPKNTLSSIKYFISHFLPVKIKKRILLRWDAVVFPTKTLKTIFGIEESKVIYPGIDIKKYKKIAFPNKNREKDKLHIGFIGSPTKAKGFYDVLNVFYNLDEKNYIKFLFLRTSSTKTKKSVHGTKKKDIYIYFLQKNIVYAYNRCDIVLLPFQHEGSSIATPLTLLEAMACERTIITTDLPNIREICGDSVIYVKPNSPKEIVKKIEYLKENPDIRKKLGKKARERVVKYFNEEKMIKEFKKLINTIE